MTRLHRYANIYTCIQVDGIRAENDRLIAENDRLRAALSDILNPIGKLRREAAAQGVRLSGAAYEIGYSVSYLQSIARDALAGKEGK